MVRSMTGYGRGEVKGEKGECFVEAKSVNHRFLEIKTKFPQKFSEVEDIVKKKIKENFSRGYFEVYISFDGVNNNERELKLDTELARQYVVAAGELKRELGIEGEVRLNDILQLNGILKFDELESDASEGKAYIKFLEDALEGAISSLKDMREKEGETLDRDIKERLKIINDHVDALKDKQPELIDNYRNRFKERLDRMLDGKEISAERLSEEIAIIAERSDVTEELIRLDSHIGQFKQHLKDGGAVGRKLEFILQEMNRETNTIGSKAVDYLVSQHVIAIKGELEKIREQVQNIE
jgi:uncharacterized protein (TIGR00255 family)